MNNNCQNAIPVTLVVWSFIHTKEAWFGETAPGMFRPANEHCNNALTGKIVALNVWLIKLYPGLQIIWKTLSHESNSIISNCFSSCQLEISSNRFWGIQVNVQNAFPQLIDSNLNIWHCHWSLKSKALYR